MPKISHVRGFKPWGWIVGTGMYLDDVTLKISGMIRKLNFVFLGILTIIGLLLFHNIRQTLALESERDEAEQSLRNSESRFRKLAENAPFGLTISDNMGKYEYINPQFTQLFGYTIAEVPDKQTWFEKAYPDPDYRQAVMKTWAEDIDELQSKGGTVERVFQVICKDHAQKTIRFRNVPIEEQRQFLTYEDVTAEEEARKGLLESRRKYQLLYKKSKMEEQLYRSLMESSADVIIIYDLDGKAQYVSRMFTELFGWSEKEVLFKRIPFLPDSEKNETRRIIDSLVREGVPCRNYETKRLTKKGNILEVSISASRYTDYKGRPAGILVIIRDIGEK
ncbi:MAG: PAS domain S-box protein, partial [Deltaproteobacteria bacterium]